MEHFSTEDVEQIVRLLAAAGDPTSAVPLPDRKRALVAGVAKLIDADVWLWNTAAIQPGRLEDVVATNVIDGGWKDDQERHHVLGLLVDPTFNQATAARVHEAVAAQRYVTFTRETFLSDDAWENIGRTWIATGLRHFLLSVYPIADGVISGIGFHRRDGRPDFTERERAVVHVVFQQVDWLHRHGTSVPLAKQALQLSPREREVLIYVLGGDSRKEIARKLGLSEHTVSDYLKRLHKHFGVKSRGALLAHFIRGGQR